ncbi:hypothetical protein AB0D60_02935 [Streptomyces sp. NPDC048306]|uniref:hypothetical protein n=1 Tax=Streptomyces sp. NPDC048306 TaxID=3154502 RepID=UPI003405E539
MNNPLTPEQAAEALRIPEEDVEAFVQFVGALRARQTHKDRESRLREDLMRAYQNAEIDLVTFRRLHDRLTDARADAAPDEYQMSTRRQHEEQPHDGEFLDDFTSGRSD